MLNNSKKTNSRSSFHRVMAATLTIGGISLLSPMLVSAQTVVPLTAAGTDIKNTATGTYQDPNDPTNTRINTTSNTVTSTVAEVAGVGVASSGTIDVNGGSVTTGDFVNFSFLITNVGNDRTALHIPITVTPVGGSIGTTTLPIGGAGAFAGSNIYVTEVNGVALSTPVLLPSDGNTDNAQFIAAVTAANGGTALIPSDGSIPIGGTIKVVVPVTVTATIAGSPVSVTLGNTGSYVGDTGTNTQNQPDSGVEPPAAAGLDNAAVGGGGIQGVTEIYTINTTGSGGSTAPANGVREASAKNTQTLAVQINNLALATVLKTLTTYSPGPLAALTDDTLTYRLDLRVESTTTIPNTSPAPLLATAIALDGVAANRILVSDAIPLLTVFDKTFATSALDGVAADGTIVIGGITWTRVYSTAATTVGPLATFAGGQNWKTATDAALNVELSAITRIGYITNGPLAAGSTTVGDANGFRFRVTTATVPATGATIANIAQVFGQTTAGAVSPTNPLVYDESGDQNPNNYEGTTAPAPITTTNTSPSGVANPATDAVDTNNDNTGAGPGGEDNTYTINPPGIILNGPLNQPGAIGPGTAGLTANNTDFVNKSALDVPAGDGVTPVTSYNPAPIKFSNSVANPNSNNDKLDNVILEPISAAQAVSAVTGAVAADYTLATNGAALINGTTVTIAYPVGSATVIAGVVTPSATGRTALYTYDGTKFNLTSSTTAGVADGTAAPIKITSLAISQEEDYEVFVDLPAGSLVSTAYSVPIVSYVDSNPATSGFKTVSTEDTPFNIKIDRAYTGYLKLDKQSQILDGTTGLPVSGANGVLDGLTKTPSPGNIIKYVVTYTNISTAQSGSATNTILNANNIQIVEDGAALTNNWASTTTGVPSTAVDSNAATLGSVITFFVGGTSSFTTDPAVTKYVDTIPTLAPSGTGTFTFQRKVK